MSRPTNPGPGWGRALTIARSEAERARHGYVGCEHLLLALLHDGFGRIAGEVFTAHGITLVNARVAVGDVISSGRGDGPRWNQTDLLATLGIDLPAIAHRTRAEFGSRAVEELYASSFGRHLRWGPLCELRFAPALKKTLNSACNDARRDGAGPVSTGHLLVGMLDSGSGGLAAVLEALGTTADQLRTTAFALVGEPAR